MPTATTSATEHQKRWQEIVEDPLLSALPYKVETNHRGQIVLSPHKNRHARRQKRIEKRLDALLPSGEAFQEWAIATAGGTKQADVIWASDERLQKMQETADPTTPPPTFRLLCRSGGKTQNFSVPKNPLAGHTAP